MKKRLRRSTSVRRRRRLPEFRYWVLVIALNNGYARTIDFKARSKKKATEEIKKFLQDFNAVFPGVVSETKVLKKESFRRQRESLLTNYTNRRIHARLEQIRKNARG